jgi:UPF0755 protein
MAGNDLPGEEFLPGFDGSSDWDYEDRRRGRRGHSAQPGGAPALGGRYPAGQYEQRRDDRAIEDRYNEDAYVGDGYAGDGYEQDRYERGSYDQDPYAGDPRDRGRYRDEDDDGRLAAGGRGRGKPKRKRSRARRLAPWIALLVLLVFIVPLAGGGLYAYRYLQAKNHPPDYPGAGAGPQILVQVMTGDTPTSLAPRLVAAGVVESDRAFILAAENSTSSANLEAGFFLMNRHMKASLAYAYLLNPKNLDQHTVTIPEGYRTVDAIKVLAQKTHIPLADFQKVLSTPSLLAQLALPPYSGGKPEGYLFPATYAITPHETALAVLQAMTNRFAQEAVSANLPASVNVPAKGGTVHLTEGQIIIVASLLQAEAGSVADMPKIAEVAYNRLKAGMPLQFDSSVFYGLGKYGTAANNAEIATPGPYNTYRNKGLPPGPIDNPGDAAIQAALHPAAGALLYFYGCPSGRTIYSATTALTKASC